MSISPNNRAEILKLAAAAAEVNFHYVDDGGVWYSRNHMSESVYRWDPIGDDDANDELARDFGIKSWYDEQSGHAVATDTKGRVFSLNTSYCNYDPASTRRLAVVFAVAHDAK